VLIINADDWGRSPEETDAALECYRAGRLTSVSAMVFMQDSERGANLAKDAGLTDVGLHLNLSQRYNAASNGSVAAHETIVRFLTKSKYAVLLYNPGLRRAFKQVFQAQFDEFVRLYGKEPSHIDGHQHRHLCANLLVDRVIPPGYVVRRNFTFAPGDKGIVNRSFRRIMDSWLANRYRIVDLFYSLKTCLRQGQLSRLTAARDKVVELMVHPVNRDEASWLIGKDFEELTTGIPLGSFSQVQV